MRVDNGGDGAAFTMQSGDSRELHDIIVHLLPNWATLFARKNADYGAGSSFELGIRGQYSDIHRKVLKLRRFMWEGETPEFEGVEEVIHDLISHLFLTLFMINMSSDAEREYVFAEDSKEFIDDFIGLYGGPRNAINMTGGMSSHLAQLVNERCVKLLKKERKAISKEEAAERERQDELMAIRLEKGERERLNAFAESVAYGNRYADPEPEPMDDPGASKYVDAGSGPGFLRPGHRLTAKRFHAVVNESDANQYEQPEDEVEDDIHEDPPKSIVDLVLEMAKLADAQREIAIKLNSMLHVR
jgi:hypothetical protein